MTSTGGARVLAIDPGPTTSGYCFYDGERVVTGDSENEILLECVRHNDWSAEVLALEWLECYGKPVGQETFHTARWIGRFEQAWRGECGIGEPELVTRPTVKLHLCNSKAAKDPHVRQVLIDRFGGSDALKKGKRCPKCGKSAAAGLLPTGCPKCDGSGMLSQDAILARVSGHGWSALALAVTVADTRRAGV